jgi:hypothetical protein
MQLVKLNDLIRVGRNYDGGYVISGFLMKQSAVLLSFGINDDWSFEEDFYKKTGIGCYGFDFSVTKKLFLKRGFQQIRFFFGDIIKRRTIDWSRIGQASHHFQLYRAFGRFFKKNKFLSFGIDSSTHGCFKSLDDILKEYLEPFGNIFLKVDIEGYEFKIMDDILKNKQRFHALAMEIHNIHGDEPRFKELMEKLKSGYYVYHVHANNYGSLEKKGGFPDVIEISCIRKDLAPSPVFYEAASHLPIEGIDFPNDLKGVDFQW